MLIQLPVQRKITYSQFLKVLENIELVETLAQVSMANWQEFNNKSDHYFQNALDGIARGLLIGTYKPGRMTTKSRENLNLLIRNYYEVVENFPKRNTPNFHSYILMQLYNEQEMYQNDNLINSIARYTFILRFCRSPKLRKLDLENLFGLNKKNLLDIWWLIYVMASRNNGCITLPIKMSLELRILTLLKGITSKKINKFIDLYSITLTSSYLNERKLNNNNTYSKYDSSGLLSNPLIEIEKNAYLVPSPSALLNSIGTGFYYKLSDLNQIDFIGEAFEEYVYLQLHNVKGLSVFKVNVSAKSKRCDLLIVGKDLNILIEIKAQRISESARAGYSNLEKSLEDCIGKSIKQINQTYKALENEDSDFRNLLGARHTVGLTILLEPIVKANDIGIKLSTEQPMIPFGILSSNEFEKLTADSTLETFEKVLYEFLVNTKSSGLSFFELSSHKLTRDNFYIKRIFELSPVGLSNWIINFPRLVYLHLKVRATFLKFKRLETIL